MSQHDDQKRTSVSGVRPAVQEKMETKAPAAGGEGQKRAAAARDPGSRAMHAAGIKQSPKGASKRNMRQGDLKKHTKRPGGKGIWEIIAAPFSAVNKKLDVFRKNEVSTIITNTLIRALGLVVLLCIFFAAKPGIDSVRAGILARSGNADKAIRIVNALERKDYSAEKLNRTRIKVARNLIGAGRQEEASSLIAGIPSGIEKAELQNAQNYARARALYEGADYSGAAQAFYQLGDYEDAAARYADSRCIMAIQTWQAGNVDSARSLLIGISDLVDHVEKAAMEVAKDENEARKILGSELFDEANLTEMERVMAELNAMRSEMPEGRIAAGWAHTVILNGDGTVRAVGDNSKAQCETGAWRNIIRVAAGGYHTVGLCADGTVLATGNNTMGQCDVSGWSDIIAVAAGTANTIGLKADGTVVAAGQHADKVAGWRDVTFVTAGSYAMGCITGNGSMLASHAGAQMDMGVSLYDLSVCGPVSVGVIQDGTLVSGFEGVPQWENIVTATACESGILGIDVDGRVLAHFYNEGSYVDISVPGKAVAIESSGTHHVVLTEDGTVYAFGNNDFGQCDI